MIPFKEYNKDNKDNKEMNNKANKIYIKKSPTADTRICDFKNVSKELLLKSSYSHKEDIKKAFEFVINKMKYAASVHDDDKIYDIDSFHDDFVTGFENVEWWKRHVKINRHHLAVNSGVPDNVNLIDVFDYIIDCIMAGMARSGSVYDIILDNGILQKAFKNTVNMIKDNTIVEEVSVEEE